MEKFIKRFGFRSLLSVIFLFGALLFNASSAQAQSSLDLTIAQPQNWKTEAEAIIALETALEQLTNDLAVLTPGSPLYRSTEGRLTLYKFTYELLQASSTVQQSIVSGVEHINDSKTTTADMYTQPEIIGFYNNAVALLTN